MIPKVIESALTVDTKTSFACLHAVSTIQNKVTFSPYKQTSVATPIQCKVVLDPLNYSAT